jgi:hypothetical protein
MLAPRAETPKKLIAYVAFDGPPSRESFICMCMANSKEVLLDLQPGATVLLVDELSMEQKREWLKMP